MDGTCQRIASQVPWVSPVQTTAFRWVPAQPSTVHTKRRPSELFSMPATAWFTPVNAVL